MASIMKIQLMGHARTYHWTIKGSAKKELIGSGDIIEYYFHKRGYKLDHIRREDWKNFWFRYRKFRPDIIMTSGPIGFLFTLLRKIGIIRVPVVHFWHDNYVETMGDKWGKTFIGFLESFIVKNSDAVITQSLYRYNRCKKLGLKIFYYIPQGVHKALFKKFKKIKLPGRNKIKLLYTGTISKQKKVDKLIRAVNGKDVDLILIGPEASNYFRKISKDNIYFLGLKRHKEIPSYLKSADILVLTEDNDSSLKFFEYAEVGKPILAPDRGRLKKLSRYLKIRSEFYNFGNIMQKIKKSIKNKREFLNNSKKVKDWSEITEIYYKNLKQIYDEFRK